MKTTQHPGALFARFAEVALRHPEAPAVTTESVVLTYRQLLARAVDIASVFPVAHPRAVGLVLPHDEEMIASILAILSVGAAYIPAEPDLPERRIRYMMSCADVSFTIPPGIPRDARPGECRLIPPGTAYVLYTSGTTGRPKGIMVSEQNVLNYARAFHAEFDNGPGDIMLQHSVISFDIFVEELFATLLNGAALAIPSPQTRADIGSLLHFIDRHGVTIVSGFPYLLMDINRHADALPPSVRLLISGGDVLRDAYIDRLKQRAVIYNTYGPSETTVCCTYCRCDNRAPLPDGTYPVGHPVEGVAVDILSPDLRPLPDGVTGEICIYGNGVSQGYLNCCPEDGNFVVDERGRRLYRSGDMGYRLPDGDIAFLHRRDRQVMIWGKRVECAEVENVLCQCPGVNTAVVLPATDARGATYLTTYVVADDPAVTPDALRHHAAQYLTAFMVPDVFILLDDIPLTANGKPDLQRLSAGIAS